MVRDRHDPGPWIPGIAQRFRWMPEDDPDVKMVRERVQDGGRNLFVLRLPPSVAGSDLKVLAVGFYPDELQSASWTLCDPRQREDWGMGRMVVLKILELAGMTTMSFGRDMADHAPGDTRPSEGWHIGVQVGPSLKAYVGPLRQDHIDEVVRNNRNARADLKRRSTASYLEKEIQNAVEADEEKKIMNSEFVDDYVDRWESTRHHALGNPRVSLYTGRST